MRGQRHYRAHHVLDQKDCESGFAVELAQNRDDPVGFGRPQASHRLVEQQQFRIGGERARHFEPFAVRQRQRRRALEAFVVEVEPAQHLVRMRTRGVDVTAMQQRADDDVVLDAQARERPHDLKGAADAAPANTVGRQMLDALAGESDGAAIGRKHSGDHVEQRGLAGTVRADHGEDAALGHLEADPVHRHKPAKPFADALNRQERAHCLRSSPMRLHSHGHTPSGSAVITSSRQMP